MSVRERVEEFEQFVLERDWIEHGISADVLEAIYGDFQTMRVQMLTEHNSTTEREIERLKKVEQDCRDDLNKFEDLIEKAALSHTGYVDKFDNSDAQQLFDLISDSDWIDFDGLYAGDSGDLFEHCEQESPSHDCKQHEQHFEDTLDYKYFNIEAARELHQLTEPRYEWQYYFSLNSGWGLWEGVTVETLWDTLDFIDRLHKNAAEEFEPITAMMDNCDSDCDVELYYNLTADGSELRVDRGYKEIDDPTWDLEPEDATVFKFRSIAEADEDDDFKNIILDLLQDKKTVIFVDSEITLDAEHGIQLGDVYKFPADDLQAMMSMPHDWALEFLIAASRERSEMLIA